ncbi:MAG: D-tyrosyl-tRNA(Tyr) deacylase [Candidatus Desulforudis sp.]|nr:D-tyrosyl-tRNA(Tyr) deacylase [Desulforudis sp.]
MRAVVQRAARGAVMVGPETVGEIGRGLVVLVGVAQDDVPDDAAYLAEKIANLRVFEDNNGKMNRSVLETGGSVLLVSQFTLYGDCRKGRRPGFSSAARPDRARELYGEVVRRLEALGVPVAEGRFQEHMRVEIINDGPVTLLLDSKKLF